MPEPYFQKFAQRRPPRFPAMSQRRTLAWHFMAGLTIGVGGWYLQWRWLQSLNPDALFFSVAVVSAETLLFLGTLLFYFDIWAEQDTPQKPPPLTRDDAHLDGSGPIGVDLYITTYDEDPEVLIPTIAAAQQVMCPPNVSPQIYLLDDGNRPHIAALAHRSGIGYLARSSNEGFKAGNLRNALMQTAGDFIVICDADTRLEPTFLQNTLGYFRNPKVAWVQTPHWFYDIPEGQAWESWLKTRLGQMAQPILPALATSLQWLTGRDRVGADPFLSEPTVFFDIIQRRRNRNGASFCCGAGSVHRREAIFAAALKRKSAAVDKAHGHPPGPASPIWINSIPLQPFRFHVSEDIYTSILLQEDREEGWTSVYHPKVEARMLSPWTMEAWATQRLKYAGGTFDIMLRDNPLFRRGLPWRHKLHYGATFWSYLTTLWLPVLLLAPVISLVTGIAPVEAYSAEFFLHFLPVIFLSEIAMVLACKGYAIQPGRALALSTLPIQLRALWLVLQGKRPRFPPTPKTPVFGQGRHHILPNLCLMFVMAGAGIYGTVQTLRGAESHDMALLITNLFWLVWNMAAVGRIALAASWSPDTAPSPAPTEETANVHDFSLYR